MHALADGLAQLSWRLPALWAAVVALAAALPWILGLGLVADGVPAGAPRPPLWVGGWLVAAALAAFVPMVGPGWLLPLLIVGLVESVRFAWGLRAAGRGPGPAVAVGLVALALSAGVAGAVEREGRCARLPGELELLSRVPRAVALAGTPSGAHLLAALPDGRVGVLDRRAGSWGALEVQADRLLALPAGPILIADSGAPRTLRWWTPGGGLSAPLTLPGTLAAMALDAGGAPWLALVDDNRRASAAELALLPLLSGQLELGSPVALPEAPRAIAIDPRADRLWSLDSAGVRALSIESGAEVTLYTPSGAVSGLHRRVEGDTVLVVADDGVSVLDGDLGPQGVWAGVAPTASALSFDGRRLASLEGGALVVRGAGDGSEAWRLALGAGPSALAFTSEGALYAASRCGMVVME